MAGRGLGTLTLALAVSLAGFTAPLDKAGRDLDKKTRAMQKRAYEFGQAIGTTLKVGAGLAVAALGIYIKNTIEAEKVQAQLASRIKDTAGVAGRSLKQLADLQDKLQRTTVFDDESIGRAEAAVLVFTRIRDLNFDRTIEAATDLATVMGTDVESAARLLGKALNDPIAGIGKLQKAGVALTESQKETIKQLVKVGDVAGAQTIILDSMAATMGTAAEAARDTLGGALQGLVNSFNNMLEGDSGSDGSRGATESINQLAAVMDSAEIKSGFDSMVQGLAFVARHAASTLAAIANLTQGLDAFGRSAGQATYDANLNKEAALGTRIASLTSARMGNASGKDIVALKAQLAEVKKLNAAYRALPGAAPVAGGVITMDPMTIYAPLKDKTGKGKGDAEARKAKAAADREAAEAAKRHAEAEDQLREAIEKTLAANVEFTTQLEDMVAQLGGPLAEAQLEYERSLKALRELAKEGEVSTTDLAKAEGLLAGAYAKTTAEIRERLDTGGQQLKHMQQELDLLNMQTNAERVRAQFLIDHPTATGEQADAAVRLDKQIEETREAISAMDDFRSSFEDFVVAAANGKASFKDFADMVIQQIIRIGAAKLTAGLFGESGTSGGGLFGSLLGSVFGGGSTGSSFTGGGIGIGGGFAMGTDYAPGGMAMVGEHGPEIVNLPRGSSVTPNHKLGRGMKPSVNFNMNGGTATKETMQYGANLLARELMKAGRGS